MVDFARGLVAEIDNTQLRRLMGNTSGSYYKALAEIMDPSSDKSLSRQWGIFIKDMDSGLYGFVNIITAMIYDRGSGKMFIKFSDETKIKSQIFDVKRGYTLLNYRVMLSFDSVYSYRLYELLMSHVGIQNYRRGNAVDEPLTNIVEMGVSLLKFRMGILDAYVSQDVKNAVAKAASEEDFDAIEEMLSKTNRRMANWRDFEKFAVKKAIDELNAIPNSEYHFEYTPIKKGRGGKVVSVRFTIISNGNHKDQEIIDSKTQEAMLETLEFVDEMRSFIKEDLRTVEFMDIAKEANYDMDVIRKAYAAAEQNGTDIENFVGFMKAAIRGGYEPNPVKKKGRSKKASSWDEIEAHEKMDYDQLALDSLMGSFNDTSSEGNKMKKKAEK